LSPEAIGSGRETRLFVQPGRWVNALGSSGGDDGASVGATWLKMDKAYCPPEGASGFAVVKMTTESFWAGR
jgi:hypothetical protein